MNEDFLHHIWKFKRFNHENLRSTTGQTIKIISYGHHNNNAGPDFLNGCVQLDNTSWHGHIELHVNSIDWNFHNHQNDPTYNNVILHVVFEDKGDVSTQSLRSPACLELKSRIDPSLFDNYTRIFKLKTQIPCQGSIQKIDSQLISIFLESLLIHRLERKLQYVESVLKSTRMNWEQSCYQLLFSYLGGPVNKDAFETLAKTLPLHLLLRYRNRPNLMEALLLGQSGLLDRLKQDDYLIQLDNVYQHLKKKHMLLPMTGLEWNFGRLRPGNSPCIRIAQVVSIYSTKSQIFRTIVTEPSLNKMHNILKASASSYWDRHYIPGRKTKVKVKTIGRQVRTDVIINAFIPLLFLYAKTLKQRKLEEVCLNMFSDIPSEKNKVTRMWEVLGIMPKNSAQSQALIELKTQYCDRYKCLNCSIGTKLLLNV